MSVARRGPSVRLSAGGTSKASTRRSTASASCPRRASPATISMRKMAGTTTSSSPRSTRLTVARERIWPGSMGRSDAMTTDASRTSFTAARQQIRDRALVVTRSDCRVEGLDFGIRRAPALPPRPQHDLGRDECCGRLSVTQDEDSGALVLGRVHQLREVCLRFGKGRLAHVTNLTCMCGTVKTGSTSCVARLTVETVMYTHWRGRECVRSPRRRLSPGIRAGWDPTSRPANPSGGVPQADAHRAGGGGEAPRHLPQSAERRSSSASAPSRRTRRCAWPGG